jgi:large subunit ribosomal protein L24
MSAAKIRKGDKVVVLSGRDKGKTGEIVSASPKDSKVVVSGVNIATRHKKATQTNPQGGLERREAPMHVSKVAIIDPKDGKATRALRDGRRQEGPRRCAVRGEDRWLKPTRRKRPTSRVCARIMTIAS